MSDVLDLGAVFDRDTVKMPDSTTYELRNAEEFGIVEDHRLRMLLKQTVEFVESGSDTEEDAAKASKMLQELATMLVVDLKGEIEDWACVAIFEFWMKHAPEAPAEPDPPKPGRKRTTAASSRASKRSTAATRKRGSTSRRGR